MQLHKRLEDKDESISSLRVKLKLLKDDIHLVHESIMQIKRSCSVLCTEDEHLQELTSEMVVMLNDCA